jgi:outer membrane autotransporter protein
MYTLLILEFVVLRIAMIFLASALYALKKIAPEWSTRVLFGVSFLFLAFFAHEGFGQSLLVDTTFQDSTAPGWSFQGSASLTSGVGTDPVGQGWLELSPNPAHLSTTGFAYLNTPVTLSAGVDIKIQYQTWGGSTAPGADGIALDLFKSATPAAGAFGGSLGYAQELTGATLLPGMNGGILGIGIDEHGNFSNPTQNRVGGPGLRADSITIRGPGNGSDATSPITGGSGPNYGFLDQVLSPYTIQTGALGATTRPTGAANLRFAEFQVNTQDLLTLGTLPVTVILSDGSGSTTVISSTNTNFAPQLETFYGVNAAGLASILSTFQIGFTSSTGAQDNVHDIRNVTVTSLNPVPGKSDVDAGAPLVDFVATGTGAAETGTNWSFGAEPVSTDDVFVSNGGTAVLTSSATVLRLDLAALSSSSSGTFTIQESGNLTATNVVVGEDGTGTLTIGSAGSGILTILHTLIIGEFSGSNGTLNLFTGGLLQVGGTNGLAAGLGTATFNFGGGLLQVIGSNLTSSVNAALTTTGSTIDTNGFSAAFSGNFTGGGALTKIGTGILMLSGTSTYNGATTVSVGTLQAGSTTAFSPSSAFTVNSTLDLNGFSNTVGSLAGTGTVTNSVATPVTLTAGGDNTSTTFSGTLVNGAGSLGLTKTGTGTLTLTGANTYIGGTTISAGVLQIGGGGTTGSIVGGVTDNGSLAFDRTDPVTFSGVISGTGSLSQLGTGTLTLTGANTYRGGTAIDRGTLIVDNAEALGSGNVAVIGGILAADRQPINVLGNYTQFAGGTLQLKVAGANPGQYDSLNIGGNAALGGTLQLISLGFQPQAGNRLTLVTTGGPLAGRFADFVNPFASGPGFSFVDLVYARQSVTLEFFNRNTPGGMVTTTDFISFALTPNEHASASLLNAVQLDPRAANLVAFLDTVPFADLPNTFHEISPEQISSFYEISFSNANIQRLNLDDRMDEIHSGSNGFSSNMKVNGATASTEDRNGGDGKTSKAVVEPILQPAPENRWGVWMTGFGDFVSVDGDGNSYGYNFTTGGVSLGVDYRLTDELAIGVMGEYSHTWTSLKPSGSIDVNSGRGGLYATWARHGLYFNGAIYGGYNNYASSRSGLEGLASGTTDGAELSTFLSGGYDFHFGPLTVGPVAALQYTYVNVNGFSESGSLAPMQIQSNSVNSLRSDVGFRLFYQMQVGKVIIEPSLKAAWEHEYLYSALPITAGFANIPGPTATFTGPAEGHDSAIVSAGASVIWTPTLTTYLNYDGQLGRENYSSNAVTGGVRISF